MAKWLLFFATLTEFFPFPQCLRISISILVAFWSCCICMLGLTTSHHPSLKCSTKLPGWLGAVLLSRKIRESALSSPGPSTLQMTLMVLFHPRWFLGFCSDPNEVSAGCFAVIYWEGSSFILWFEGSSSADQIQGHPLKANDHEWSQERLQTLQFPYQMDRFSGTFGASELRSQ